MSQLILYHYYEKGDQAIIHGTEKNIWGTLLLTLYHALTKVRSEERR